MSERPWLSIDFMLDYPIEFQSTGDIGVRIHPIIKNIGHSVATNIRIILGATPEGGGFWFNDVRNEQKKDCDTWRSLNFNDDARVGPLFEGQTYTENTSFTISKADIGKYVITMPDGTKAITGISLYGCLDYRFAFAPEHHQTGFWYDIVELGYVPNRITKFNEATGGASYWPLGKNIPPSKLVVRRSIFGGFYVD